MRADSGFYNHAVDAVCRKQDVRFSITIRQQPSVRRLIEAIPEEDWTPIPYWLPGGADVAETTSTPFQHTGGATAVALFGPGTLSRKLRDVADRVVSLAPPYCDVLWRR